MSTTFATQLRALTDDGLAALLALRPDLVAPVPADISALATRAQSRVSVARALDGLDQFTLEILDGLRLGRDATGHTPISQLLGWVAAAPSAPRAEAVLAAVDRLRARFLVYGTTDAARIAAGVDEACSRYPAGLGRPAAELSEPAAALCADPAKLRRTVLAAPTASRAVLDRLAAGPPLGSCPSSATTDASHPVGWLVHRHLLVVVPAEVATLMTAGPIPDDAASESESASASASADDPLLAAPGTGSAAVELPREVGWLLRRDTGPLGSLHPQPVVLPEPTRRMAGLDAAGAGQAVDAVRHVEALLEALAAEPAGILRAGGMAVRDLRRLARAAGVTEPAAATLLEVAADAGLLGEAAGERSSTVNPGRFLPTAAYDHWRAIGAAARWERLAKTWLGMCREPHLAGTRDDRGRLRAALGIELERVSAPATRAAVLDVLAAAPAGTPAQAEAMVTVLAWQQPRRFRESSGRRAEAVVAALADAALLGITSLGALTSFGRLLLEEVQGQAGRDPDDDPLGLLDGASRPVRLVGGTGRAGGALDALLPPPVDHFLLQADLTLVVPGPAEPRLADELGLIAEPESAGGASVYRVTEPAIRRALDAGCTAADLHALLARRSRTPVPQALQYLIDDVARRHGGLRVGGAGCYLRSDDEGLLAEVSVDRRLGALGLRRLAPTVLICPYPSGRLLSALRDAGYAPVVEDASGAAVLIRPRVRRAPPRRSTNTTRAYTDRRPKPAQLLGIVEELRRGDRQARALRRAPISVRTTGSDAGSHTQALAVLQQAMRERSRVWVGYVDAHGGNASRLVRPVSMAAGYLRAQDDRTDMLHTFALHRITAAVPES